MFHEAADSALSVPSDSHCLHNHWLLGAGFGKVSGTVSSGELQVSKLDELFVLCRKRIFSVMFRLLFVRHQIAAL